MPETVDTQRPFFLIPEGDHILTILEVPLKKRTKSAEHIGYEFKFGYSYGGKKRIWTAFFMAWDLPAILKALKFEQTSEHSFNWEREACKDRAIKAKVIHQPDAKDPMKVWPRIETAVELTDETLSF